MVGFNSPEYTVLDGFRSGDTLPSREIRQEMAATLLETGYEVVLGVCCEADQHPVDALTSALPQRQDLAHGIVGPCCYEGNTPHGAALWQKRHSQAL